VTTGVGAVNACSDAFLLTVTGAGGHGAYPHHGHDPVLALAQVIVALQQIVSRRTDPMHPTVVSVGRLEAGSAANVIPGVAVAEGTIRVLRPEDREEVLGLVSSISRHVAAGFGCEARVEIKPGDPALINDAELVGAVDPWLERSGFEVAEPMRSCGADDFAFYSEIAPSLMMFLGVQGAGSGAGRDPGPGLHHPEFLPPEEAVHRAAKALLAGYAGAAELALADR
jgi:amidohydrolase